MKKKKILSIGMVCSLIVTMFSGAGLSQSQISQAAEPQKEMLAHYQFVDEQIAVGDSTVEIKDTSGNNNHAFASSSVWGNGVKQQNNNELYFAGGSSSSSDFVTLPGEMFKNQDELTITFWLKNDTNANYYAAMYFGDTTIGTPQYYWLFCPSNQDGVMKSVLTVESHQKEQGISPWNDVQVVGPATDGNWNMYTTVITANTITGYYNGANIGTANTTVKVSDFGSSLVGYMGKSAYNDELFKGGMKDVRIYSEILSDQEITDLYVQDAEANELVESAAREISIPEAEAGQIYTNTVNQLTLPTSWNDGKVNISWQSSMESCISSTGRVTAPDSVKNVTLTATITAGSASTTKAITVTVHPANVTEIVTKYSLDLDKEQEGVEISQELFGLFYEDINSSADGGLYPEMVKNNSFENYINNRYYYDPGNETTWKLHWVDSGTGDFRVVKDSNPGTSSMNDKNPNYAIVTGNLTLTNGGFAPKSAPNSASMPMKKDHTFDFSMYMKADSGYDGKVFVQVLDASNNPLTDKEEVTLETTGEWEKVTTELTARDTKKGKIVLSIEGAAAGAVMNLDLVSLLPRDTYGYGDKNYAYGAGVRADLVEMLRDLNPSFMRFPGGCIIEGDGGWESYYNWEESIGPIEERKAIANRWQHRDSAPHNLYGYMQSRGFGYHEMLTLCDDFGMEAFPILSAGVLCQYEAKDYPPAQGEELIKFAKHATNLIDYCWGSVDSTNPTEREWAEKRTENGHPEPFSLNYIGIGNENWYEKYLDNFDFITEYIEEHVEENYPGRKITVISSTGPNSDGNEYKFAWNWFNDKYPGELLVDEHYYQDANYMLNNTDRYDYYNRLDKGGSDVFVGEYATHVNGKHNNLASALSDAAYMTGFERNGDIVRHTSYAPLFNKVGASDWTPDLIWFDEYESFGTPNYYVQQMYAQNYGERVIDTKLSALGKNYTQNTGSLILATWATAGEVDSVKVVRADGKVLLDEDFSDNSSTKNLWSAFPGSGTNFSISGGKLILDNTSGFNGVWIPSAVNNPEWYDYTVTAVVRKTSGKEGFMVGVGAKDGDNYYMYNMGGSSNTKTIVERRRAALGNTTLSNQFETGFTPIETGKTMTVTVNYGVDNKLEAGYVTDQDTSKEKDFVGNLKPYQTDIYEVASVDEEYIYVKLINNESVEKPITLHMKNYDVDDSKPAEVICLTGDPSAVNTIANQSVVPTTVNMNIRNNKIIYNIPKDSFSVVKIPLVKDPVAVSYTVTYEALKGGAIKGSAIQKVTAGGNTKEVTAVANTGYEFVKWSDGKTSAARFEQNVREDKKLTAEFKEKTVPDPAPLGKVTGVKASAQKTNSLKISWSKVSGAAGYEVERYNSKTKKWTVVTDTKALNFTQKKLSKATKYDYRVRAYALSGNTKTKGSYSSVLKTATAPAKPAIKVSKKNPNKVLVSWKKVKGASGYKVEMKTGSKKYKNMKTLTKNKNVKFKTKKLKNGKYTFRVQAFVKVNGKKIYGKYSSPKKINIK